MKTSIFYLSIDSASKIEQESKRLKEIDEREIDLIVLTLYADSESEFLPATLRQNYQHSPFISCQR